MSERSIPTVLEKYIATRDRKQKHPISDTPLRDQFFELLEKGKVEVGGRSSCGGRVDPTWVCFTSWNEVVRKATAVGYQITTSPVKHANKSPTMAGGFWSSNIYTLTSAPGGAS